MEVNCETIAVIAATFANGGVCPLTREAVVAPEVCRDVLSLLHSCGFYEYSGNFAFKVSGPIQIFSYPTETFSYQLVPKE